jgi:hypothetical protein
VKIKTLYTLRPTNAEHLARVREEMRRLGPPTVRAVIFEDHYFALEGAHRIEAARLLRLPINVQILTESMTIAIGETDLPINVETKRPKLTVGECVALVRSPFNGEYHINEDGTVKLISAAKSPASAALGRSNKS